MAKKIIDIYHGDRISTYDEICNNTHFIIHKATQGTSFVDKKAKDRCAEFEKRKHPYWLYVFLNKGNELDQVRFMIKEFENFVQNKNYFIGWVLDIEQDNSESNCIAAYKHLYEYCKKHNHKIMIYFMYSQYGTYKNLINLTKSQKGISALWEARYTNTNKCHSDIDLWQYTDSGACIGMINKGDVNKLTGNRALAWFTTKYVAVKSNYDGMYPAFDENRPYYMRGDGITTMLNYPTQLKRVQLILQWGEFYKGEIDGKLGSQSEVAIKSAQAFFELPVTGKFDEKLLAKFKAYKK